MPRGRSRARRAASGASPWRLRPVSSSRWTAATVAPRAAPRPRAPRATSRRAHRRAERRARRRRSRVGGGRVADDEDGRVDPGAPELLRLVHADDARAPPRPRRAPPARPRRRRGRRRWPSRPRRARAGAARAASSRTFWLERVEVDLGPAPAGRPTGRGARHGRHDSGRRPTCIAGDAVARGGLRAHAARVLRRRADAATRTNRDQPLPGTLQGARGRPRAARGATGPSACFFAATAVARPHGVRRRGRASSSRYEPVVNSGSPARRSGRRPQAIEDAMHLDGGRVLALRAAGSRSRSRKRRATRILLRFRFKKLETRYIVSLFGFEDFEVAAPTPEHAPADPRVDPERAPAPLRVRAAPVPRERRPRPARSRSPRSGSRRWRGARAARRSGRRGSGGEKPPSVTDERGLVAGILDAERGGRRRGAAGSSRASPRARSSSRAPIDPSYAPGCGPCITPAGWCEIEPGPTPRREVNSPRT